MKHTNKKGFTIVELVIVIAVIAILAAVLIPTFTNLVKKANQSADMQAARQMSTVLSAEPGIGNDIDKVIDLLVEAGYNAAESLKPITKDHAFYYFVDGEFIALVDTAKGEVVFPKDTTIPEDSALYFDLGASAKYIDVVANNVEAFEQAITAGCADIALTDNIIVTEAIRANGETTIDLGGKTLSAGFKSEAEGRHHYALEVYGTVTITNGTIEARGIEVKNGGTLILGEGVTVNALDTNGGAAVYVYAGGNLVINGGTYTAKGVANLNDLSKNPGVISNNGGTVTINNGTFKSENTVCYLINNNSGTVTIKDGTFEGTHGILSNTNADSTITVKGGNFTLKAFEDGTFKGHICYATAGKIIIEGGTFTTEGRNNSFHGSVEDNRQ